MRGSVGKRGSVQIGKDPAEFDQRPGASGHDRTVASAFSGLWRRQSQSQTHASKGEPSLRNVSGCRRLCLRESIDQWCSCSRNSETVGCSRCGRRIGVEESGIWSFGGRQA
ncbi:unnamed protein product [Ostreobium quekettii]|uniref:Uncharacterized protein n=1 Tax=Ostreobium quekettii TaxID=121088 RepID=A0A8S1J5D1_9CHLO|nr:unnamed protein product [Ostreobium quekettii]